MSAARSIEVRVRPRRAAGRRTAWLLLLATLPVAWWDAPVARADSPALAVLPLEIVGNVPAGRPALETAVTRGLTVYSGPTIEAAQASAKLTAAKAQVPCQEAACWTAAGKTVGARYLVAGHVERKGTMFEVQFRLFDAPSGRLLATENNRCEADDCSVAELCRLTVRELARQTLGGAPMPTTAAPAAAPTPAPKATSSVSTPRPPQAGPAPAPLVATDSAALKASVDRSSARVPGFLAPTAIVAGAAGLAVGAWLDQAGRRLRGPVVTVQRPEGNGKSASGSKTACGLASP